MNIQPTGAILGARVTGVNLTHNLSDPDFGSILHALGEYGVLCFPDQLIEAASLKQFSERFGHVQVLSVSSCEPGMPEVSILSNITKDGQYIGTPDAGQDWHTDMTYNKDRGFLNVLVAHAVPMRDGKPLGGTEFVNTQAAYADLPEEIKQRFANATATHEFAKFSDMMRIKKGSTRPPIPQSERAKRPPVQHPVYLTHPITGRKVIYVNPGFVECIDGLDADESNEALEMLYQHVLQPKYHYVHEWTVGDVLVWDHLGTWHNARADYRPDEYRLMKRCQVMADKVFEPGFVRQALQAARLAA